MPATPPRDGGPAPQAGESLYTHTRLPPRVRTIAILRIGGLLRCAYEWGGQVAFWGPIAGVSGAEADALAVGVADDTRWGPSERVVIEAVDEVERTGVLVGADLGRAGRRLRRRTADGTAHRGRLVPDHLHPVAQRMAGNPVTVSRRWAATVGYTEAGRPLCAEVAAGVFAFGGYNGTDNLVGPVAARAAVALAFDGSPVPDYFCG